MARFRFKLEPLLTVRRRREQTAQRKVAELERLRTDLEESLRRRQGEISSNKSSLKDRLVGTLDVDNLRAHAGATIGHLRSANRILLDLAGVHKRLEVERAELIEAARQRRAVELLRDRRYEAWRHAINRAEDAVIDELANNRAGRSPELGL